MRRKETPAYRAQDWQVKETSPTTTKFWWAPNLTLKEANETAALWRSWGIPSIAAKGPRPKVSMNQWTAE